MPDLSFIRLGNELRISLPLAHIPRELKRELFAALFNDPEVMPGRYGVTRVFPAESQHQPGLTSDQRQVLDELVDQASKPTL